MITRRLVWSLGASQLVMWGVTYYLAAVFGDPIVAETGWSRTTVFGGFSAALVVMGLASGTVGRWIDRHGGRPVMSAGSVIAALGCLLLAAARDVVAFYVAWLLLGLAMRMALYEAAFATLARIGGPEARRPISQVTLLGGIASSVMWLVGGRLVELWGWRPALVAYAGLALATLPLHLSIPDGRHGARTAGAGPLRAPLADTPRRKFLAGALFATLATLVSFLNSAMSAHMISILAGLGVAASAAVWIASLRGVGQSASRLAEVLFGRRLDPFALGLLASAPLPICFVLGLQSGSLAGAGIAFAAIYGAGNGLMTIVRGTQPLLLFDTAAYGAIVGRLLGPSFFLAALAPAAYASLMEAYGPAATLKVSIAVSAVVFACSLGLWAMFRGEALAEPVSRSGAGPAAPPP